MSYNSGIATANPKQDICNFKCIDNHANFVINNYL